MYQATRAPTFPLTKPITGDMDGVAFSPLQLFQGGTQGLWYDPSDYSTLFQDTAGTTPVTALNQSVRLMKDKSGRGNHVTFSGTNPPVLKKRPYGQEYLQPIDATSRGLVTSFSLPQPYSVAVAFDSTQQATTPTNNIIFDQYTNNNGSFVYVTTSLTRVLSDQVNGLGAASSSIPLGADVCVGVSSPTVGRWKVNGISYGPGNSGAYGLVDLSLFNIAGNPNPFASPYNSTLPFYGLILVAGAMSSGTEASLEGWLRAKVPITSPFDNYGILGDSTVAAYLGQNAVSAYLPYSLTSTSTATPGDTIAQQQSRWSTDVTAAQKRRMHAVFVQVGLNDLDPAEAASVAIGRYQTMIDYVNSIKAATTKIIAGTMTPCRSRLITLYGSTNGPIAYQKWLDINSAITTKSITGIDFVASEHTALLSDGSGNLAAAYDTGDGIHENNAGRQIIAASWVKAASSVGIV